MLGSSLTTYFLGLESDRAASAGASGSAGTTGASATTGTAGASATTGKAAGTSCRGDSTFGTSATISGLISSAGASFGTTTRNFICQK